MQRKLLIIVGGSNKIGLSLIKKALNKNYKVISTYNNNKSYFDHIISNNFKKCHLNILNNKSIDKLFDKEIKNNYLNVNLINLSAFNPGRKNLLEYSNSDLKKIISTNLTGSIILTKIFCIKISKFKFKNFNNIIHVSSKAGIFGGINISPYAASKGGMNTFVKGSSKELYKIKILINCIAPGTISNNKTNYAFKSKPNRILKLNDVSKKIFEILNSKNLQHGKVLILNKK